MRGRQSAPCLRLLCDPPTAGPLNMAIDDALLEAPDRGGEFTVRFYRWVRPTVSLGYSQRWVSGFVPVVAAREAIAVVRRRTGGRAVLHAGELTYAVVGDSEHGPLAGGIQATYSTISAGLVDGLRQLGVAAEIVRSRGRRDLDEAGACFAARALNEVVADGRKLIGSAQRRAAGRVLQHGSILLAAPDPRLWRVLGPSGPIAARESVGLFELLGARVGWRRLTGVLAHALGRRMGLKVRSGTLSVGERRQARSRVVGYQDTGFLRRR